MYVAQRGKWISTSFCFSRPSHTVRATVDFSSYLMFYLIGSFLFLPWVSWIATLWRAPPSLSPCVCCLPWYSVLSTLAGMSHEDHGPTFFFFFFFRKENEIYNLLLPCNILSLCRRVCRLLLSFFFSSLSLDFRILQHLLHTRSVSRSCLNTILT
jgi:hypothetical protein